MCVHEASCDGEITVGHLSTWCQLTSFTLCQASLTSDRTDSVFVGEGRNTGKMDCKTGIGFGILRILFFPL